MYINRKGVLRDTLTNCTTFAGMPAPNKTYEQGIIVGVISTIMASGNINFYGALRDIIREVKAMTDDTCILQLSKLPKEWRDDFIAECQRQNVKIVVDL